jgi:hypothetical protein
MEVVLKNREEFTRVLTERSQIIKNSLQLIADEDDDGGALLAPTS